MSDLDLDELRAELDDFAQPKIGGRPAREERIIAGFEEVQRFAETTRPRPFSRRRSRYLSRDFMLCALTDCVLWKNAGGFLRPSTIKVCSPVPTLFKPQSAETY